MDGLRRLLDRLRASDARGTRPEIGRLIAPVPPVIAERLIPDNEDEPLFPKFKRYGKGKPGVAQVEDEWWVIRDDRGRIVGGAIVGSIGPDHPVSIDVAVDPQRQGQGYGTALYAALLAGDIDVEAGSAASLAHRSMTSRGCIFMRSRRLRNDPEAEASICATAHVCPGCGPLP
jgi:GNAT superfamily N-acetyltransferase